MTIIFAKMMSAGKINKKKRRYVHDEKSKVFCAQGLKMCYAHLKEKKI